MKSWDHNFLLLFRKVRQRGRALNTHPALPCRGFFPAAAHGVADARGLTAAKITRLNVAPGGRRQNPVTRAPAYYLPSKAVFRCATDYKPKTEPCMSASRSVERRALGVIVDSAVGDRRRDLDRRRKATIG